MKRPAAIESSLTHLLKMLGEEDVNIDEAADFLAIARANPEVSRMVDRALVEQIVKYHQGLNTASEAQKELRKLIDRVMAPPWHVSTFLHAEPDAARPRACVAHGNSRRIVSFGEGVDPGSLRLGDAVYLSAELNAIMCKASNGVVEVGETAVFDREAGNGRLIVRWRDEEVLAFAAPALAQFRLRNGDLVRWDRLAGIVYERIERSQSSSSYLEETPTVTFADMGGLDSQIKSLTRSLTLHLKYPGIAKKYRQVRKGSVLFEGPPGNGKTMFAKAVANWLATLSNSGRSRFMNIKPSALHSMWFGESERNYREIFRIAAEAAAAEPDVPVAIFFDEVDSIGTSRGHSNHKVDDKVLAAFLAELDGLAARPPNILVMAATNRRDAMDQALVRPGRLGDLILEVPRPKMAGARAILAGQLRSDLPYARNGHGDDTEATRMEIIETAVARIYAPNGAGALATLVFRDGHRQTVRPPDLVSGALLVNAFRSASERASYRHVETGREGLEAADLTDALDEEFTTAARALTPSNSRQYLQGLPQDSDVVSVEPVVRKVSRPQQHLTHR